MPNPTLLFVYTSRVFKCPFENDITMQQKEFDNTEILRTHLFKNKFLLVEYFQKWVLNVVFSIPKHKYSSINCSINENKKFPLAP